MIREACLAARDALGALFRGDSLRMSPENRTTTVMFITRKRIEKYCEVRDKLPRQLSELPGREDHENIEVDGWGRPLSKAMKDELALDRQRMDNAIDGWGRPLLFEAGENEIVLRSHGADGVAGGDTADYEMKITRDPVTGELSHMERKIEGGKVVWEDAH